MTNREAISVLEAWIERDKKMEYADRLENIEIYNMAIKALEQEPKTGHWIKSTNGYNATSYMCSECGHWHPLHNHSLGFRYCNWCGAKMVEPQESEEV